MTRYDPRLGEEIERNRKAVKELKLYILKQRWTHYITLNFNWRHGRVSDALAERRFWEFMEALDIFLFGNKKYRYSRTRAMGLQENVSTNRHIHVLAQVELPKWEKMRAQTIQNIWSSVVASGTTDLAMVKDVGAADYCTKQLWMPGNYDRVLYSEWSEEPEALPWLPKKTLFD